MEQIGSIIAEAIFCSPNIEFDSLVSLLKLSLRSLLPWLKKNKGGNQLKAC